MAGARVSTWTFFGQVFNRKAKREDISVDAERLPQRHARVSPNPGRTSRHDEENGRPGESGSLEEDAALKMRVASWLGPPIII